MAKRQKTPALEIEAGGLVRHQGQPLARLSRPSPDDPVAIDFCRPVSDAQLLRQLAEAIEQVDDVDQLLGDVDGGGGDG